MTTVTIQIGNSDDKLSQVDWARFVRAVKFAIESHGVTTHFFGAPVNWEYWQNVAWVLAVSKDKLSSLKETITQIRMEYKQDSVAWTEGETEFV